jgi:hypothetical protein
MGIQDRDYMKSSSGGFSSRANSTDEKVEALLGGFLQKHRRLLMIAGFILGLLIIAGIIMAVA